MNVGILGKSWSPRKKIAEITSTDSGFELPKDKKILIFEFTIPM